MNTQPSTKPANPAPSIRLLDVEDTINTSLNAALMTSTFFEGMLNGVLTEESNTAAYTVGHMVDAVRDAHDHFHEYLQQEFARHRADIDSHRIPDPQKAPTFAVDGLYRFRPMVGRDLFCVRWCPELGLFELTDQDTGERVLALSQEMFERNVKSMVMAMDVPPAAEAPPVARPHEVDANFRAAINEAAMEMRTLSALMGYAKESGHDDKLEDHQACRALDAIEKLQAMIEGREARL